MVSTLENIMLSINQPRVSTIAFMKDSLLLPISSARHLRSFSEKKMKLFCKFCLSQQLVQGEDATET